MAENGTEIKIGVNNGSEIKIDVKRDHIYNGGVRFPFSFVLSIPITPLKHSFYPNNIKKSLSLSKTQQNRTCMIH